MRGAKTRIEGVREEVSAADVLVDGIGIGDIGSVVLRDRHQLSQDGFFIAMLFLSFCCKRGFITCLIGWKPG